jgi:lysine decarboxylase
VSAELITPYPPGIPAVTPGELLNDAVINYLRTGADAGMNLPDASDGQVHKFKVVA